MSKKKQVSKLKNVTELSIKDLPLDCINDLSSPGDQEETANYWTETLGFSVPKDNAMRYIKSFGCFDKEELNSMTRHELNRWCLWSACCDFSEFLTELQWAYPDLDHDDLMKLDLYAFQSNCGIDYINFASI